MRIQTFSHSWRDFWCRIRGRKTPCGHRRGSANVLFVALCLSLLVACFPLDERTATPTLAPAPTATPAARLALPDGYTAYPNVAVVVVDIDLNGTQGAAAQEAIIEQVKAQGIDVLVLGCMVIDDVVSVCPTTPFFVRGGASVGTKRAQR